MTQEAELVFSRPESLSDVVTHYCPGCIHGIAHRLIAETEAHLKGHSTEAMVSEIMSSIPVPVEEAVQPVP